MPRRDTSEAAAAAPTTRSTASIACSKEADAKGLHGKAREGFSIDPKLYAGLYFIEYDPDGSPCTTSACTEPSSRNTSIMRAATARSATPITWCFAPAGFVIGPSTLNTVRVASSRRTGAAWRIAGWCEGANMKPILKPTRVSSRLVRPNTIAAPIFKLWRDVGLYNTIPGLVVDIETGTAGKEPIRTLARYRRRNNNVFFGENVIHAAPGVITMGDAVVVTSRRAVPPARSASRNRR